MTSLTLPRIHSRAFYDNVFSKIYELTADEFLNESQILRDEMNRMKFLTAYGTFTNYQAKVSYMKQWGDMVSKMKSLFGTYSLFLQNNGEQLLAKITALKETPFQLREYGTTLSEYFNSFGSNMSKFIECTIIDYTFSLYHENLNFVKEFGPTVNADVQALLEFIKK